MRKFEIEKRVIYYETDAMGIVHHSNYIRYFEIARTEMLRAIGYPHAELEKMGIWIPVLEVSCEYKIPAVYDDLLTIRCWVDKLKGASIYIAYEIIRKETGELLVTGKSGHGFTDPNLTPIRLRREYPHVYRAMAGAEK